MLSQIGYGFPKYKTLKAEFVCLIAVRGHDSAE